MSTTLDLGDNETYPLNTIEEAIDDLRAGKCIILLDREDRENEGDLVCAAEFATPENINLMVRHARGLICAPITQSRATELDLDFMVQKNTESHRTAFTVSVDLIDGTTTGISASDRAKTIQALTSPSARPEDFARPGHVFPLIARRGGVLVRTGQTEGSIDLCKLAGLRPAAAICEILNEDGTMARMPELVEFAKSHDLKLVTVPQIIDFRRRHEHLVQREFSSEVETEFGPFTLHMFSNRIDDRPLTALVRGDLGQDNRPPLVRVQVEDVLSDVLSVKLPKARGTTRDALRMISDYGHGVLILIIDPDRMSKLDDKLHRLVNPRPPSEATETRKLRSIRDIGIGAQVLRELGVRRMRLIANNPERQYPGVEAFKLDIIEQVPFD